MNQKLKTRVVLICLIGGLLIVASGVFHIMLTRAGGSIQNNNSNTNSQKKARIEEVTVRESPTRVSVKSGYEFVLKKINGRNEVTVRSTSKLTTHDVIIGSYSCACTDSSSNSNSSGTCDGELVRKSFACVPQGCKACALILP
jgi:hypothetical protein